MKGQMGMNTKRITKRFCRARDKDVIVLEEKVENGSTGEKEWKVLLCRDLDDECGIKSCEFIDKNLKQQF